MEGMTLYNILEKVDLLNFSFEDDVIVRPIEHCYWGTVGAEALDGLV